MGKSISSCSGNCLSCFGLSALLVILGFVGFVLFKSSDNNSDSSYSIETSTKSEKTSQTNFPRPINDIARLRGKTPEELKSLGFEFDMPEEPNWEAGVVPKFRTTSWKEGYFSFNGKGLLTSVDLYPKTAINYNDAVKIMNQMGIPGEPNVDAPCCWRWEAPSPDFTTAFIGKVEPNEVMVNQFFVSLSIAWDQEKP